MYKKIIIPLDGSELAETVLPYAEEDAGRTGSELILISVRDAADRSSPRMLESYLEKMAETARVNAEQYQEHDVEVPLKVRWEILKGNPPEEIVAFADKQEDSCIMMATHGQSGLTRWALGGVADKVSRVTDRPIILIRAKGSRPAVHERGFFNKVVATLDGSPESEVVLPHLEEAARSWDAGITLLQVIKSDDVVARFMNIAQQEMLKENSQKYMEQIVGNLKSKGLEAKYVLLETEGDAADAINNYTRENYTDLVIMATHGRSGPRRWILGSIANKVLNEGNTPIMLIRTPDRK